MKEVFVVDKVEASKITLMSPSMELHNIGTRVARKPMATVTSEIIAAGQVEVTLYDPIFEKNDIVDIGHSDDRETFRVVKAIGKNITISAPAKFNHHILSRIAKSQTETTTTKKSEITPEGQTTLVTKDAIFEPGMLVELGGKVLQNFALEQQAALMRRANAAEFAGAVNFLAPQNSSDNSSGNTSSNDTNLLNPTPLTSTEEDSLKSATGSLELPTVVVRLEMASGRTIGFSGLPPSIQLPEGTPVRRREYTYFLNNISAYWAEFRVADPLLKAGDVVQLGNAFPKLQAIVTATRFDDISPIISFETTPLPFAFLAGTKIELYKFAETVTLASIKEGHKGCVVRNNVFDSGDVIRVSDKQGFEDFEVWKTDGTRIYFKEPATKNFTNKGERVYKITTTLTFKVQDEWRDIYVNGKIFKTGDIIFIGPPEAGEMAKVWHIYTNKYGVILTLDHGVTRAYDAGVSVTLIDPSVMVPDYQPQGEKRGKGNDQSHVEVWTEEKLLGNSNKGKHQMPTIVGNTNATHAAKTDVLDGVGIQAVQA